MSKKVYLAGPLFTPADRRQRILEENTLRDIGYEVYNPCNQPMNTSKDEMLPTPEFIYENDLNELLSSDLVVADVTVEDPGVMAELGIASAKSIPIIGINYDCRLGSANEYKIPPFGVNHFVYGLILKNGEYIVINDFDTARELLKRKLNQIK